MEVGRAYIVTGLKSREDLNGKQAIVHSRDVKRDRWNVFVEGEVKKLSLRDENLTLPVAEEVPVAAAKGGAGAASSKRSRSPATEAAASKKPKSNGKAKSEGSPAAEALPPKPKSNGKAKMEVSPATEVPPPKPKSSGKAKSVPHLKASQSDAWEAALDAMQPAEDEDGGEAGEAGAASTAAKAAAPARDPRMRGFRIGGQGETEAERGEGWCGPWSTATRLVEQREAAKESREEAIAAGRSVAPLNKWTPRRDAATAPRRASSCAAVPSLQELAVGFLVQVMAS